MTSENGAIICASPSKVFLAETKQNPCSIPHALSTWMILEVWELIGCVVGMPNAMSCHACHATYEYFDSFGLPPPLEWEKEMSMHGIKHFFRNDNQIQWEQSVRCGYYCLLFLNERNKGTSFVDILKMFSDDLLQNEQISKELFFIRYIQWKCTV